MRKASAVIVEAFFMLFGRGFIVSKKQWFTDEKLWYNRIDNDSLYH
ncbi:hypothetical protein S101395_01863 [Bacillus sonorensis]|uniref:Uncharacterized protein n=1 Tax=Bacillus sonorensis TaxID=119858 RepID=A0ABM6LGH4_9BACI|nr:hypothetical protein S101395_01863 [Bacillus sonorensis]TWK76126.1 hypothetical protein CHCC20335_3891 [Bacillus paralicheniformis]